MLKTFEGYLENDRFYPSGATMSVQGRRKVVVTILDESNPVKEEKLNTWVEIKKLVSEMNEDEKPCFGDFPRLNVGRKLIDFDGVS